MNHTISLTVTQRFKIYDGADLYVLPENINMQFGLEYVGHGDDTDHNAANDVRVYRIVDQRLFAKTRLKYGI